MYKLLGDSVYAIPETSKLASPVHQVDATDPPMFIIHGEQDNQVPINQSIELYTTYGANNLIVQIEYVPTAGHSSPLYFKKPLLDKIDKFLRTNLKLSN
jgi:dipeptidyl aminopeptidase/acylaminoacyl peptidase